MKRNSVHIRAYPEEKEKLKQLARELSAIEKKEVKTAEALRRALKTSNKNLLLSDAEMKRRLSRL